MLPNGVTVVTRQRPGSQVVAIDLAVRAGARYETASTASAARVLESALLMGTEQWPSRDLLLRTISGRGGQLSVVAGREIVEVSVAVSLPDLDHALDVLGDVVLRSRFDPDDLERERAVILGQIQEHEDEPEEHAGDVFYETVFAGHPLSNRPTGTLAGASALTVDELRAYWKERLVGPNVIVGVVSGLSDEAVVERLGAALGGIPDGPATASNYRDLPAPTMQTLRVPGGSDQAYVYVGAPLPAIGNPDRAPLRVLSAILGRTSGRLFSEIRDRLGLAYSTYAAVPQFPDGGAFFAYAGTAPATANQVTELLKSELARMVDTPPSATELQNAIEGEIGSRTVSSETSPSEVIWLTRDTVFGLPPREIQAAQLRAVTPADVQRVARLYLDPARFTIVVAAHRRRVGRGGSAMRRSLVRVLASALAAATIMGGSVSPGAGANDEPDVYRTTLPNGLRAIVRERPGSDVVAVSVGIRGGSRDERADTVGAAHFMEHMFFQGTPRRPTSADIGRELEARGGWKNAWTSWESINFQVVAPDDNLDLAIDVISDQMVNSLFAEDKIDKERRVVLEELNGRLSSPQTKAFDLFLVDVFGEHPARNLPIGNRETINRSTRDVVVSFRDTYFVASNMAVAVVGDVQHDEVFARLATAFEGMRTGPTPPPNAAPIPPQVARTMTSTSPGQQARVVLGGPTFGVDNPDHYVYDVIYALLGEAGRRLERKLVDEQAIASSAYAFYFPLMDVGVWGVGASMRDADVDAVLAGLKEELRILRDQPATRPTSTRPRRSCAAAACSIASRASTWPRSYPTAKCSAPTRAPIPT